MFRDGWTAVTSVDYSDVCIAQMTARFPDTVYLLADVRDMKQQFASESFDFAIDKGACCRLLFCSASMHLGMLLHHHRARFCSSMGMHQRTCTSASLQAHSMPLRAALTPRATQRPC
jgi:hypothetical protein